MDRKNSIVKLAYVEHKVKSDLATELTLKGFNSNGTQVSVTLPDLQTYMLTHVIDECAEALHTVQKRVNNDIRSAAQNFEDA